MDPKPNGPIASYFWGAKPDGMQEVGGGFRGKPSLLTAKKHGAFQQILVDGSETPTVISPPRTLQYTK